MNLMYGYNNLQLAGMRTRPRHTVQAETGIWLFFVIAMFFKCQLYQFGLGLNSKPYFSTINFNMYLMTLSSILIVTAVILMPFNRKRIFFLLGVDCFLSLLLFADTIYYRYYYNAITVSVLYQIKLVGSVGDSADNLFKLKDLLYFADIPLIIGGIVYLKNSCSQSIRSFKIILRAITAAIALGLGILVFLISYKDTSPESFFYDNTYVIDRAGIMYFHYFDAKKFVIQNFFTNRKLSASEKKELESFFTSKKSGTTYDNTGAAKGKNLIVVQVEALQQFVINTEFNGQVLTPNLNKLIKESAYFNNYYFMTGAGNTSDAEFLSNNSLYPVKDGSVYFMYPSNTYQSLAKLLKRQGYSANVLHANSPSFWNRSEMYKAVGFDRFFDRSDFKKGKIIGWGLADKEMFTQSFDMFDTSKPFYNFYITLSSHHPFNYFDDDNSFNAGEYSDNLVGRYMKAVHYADEALGSFIDELKQKGLYDNSVLVIYGDHSAVQKEYDQIQALGKIIGYKDSNFNWSALQKVPCIIHYPGMKETGTISKIGGEIDLLPTIANLMGIEAPYALGKDLFNSPDSYAVLRSGTVITDKFVYLQSEDSVYDTSGNKIKGDAYTDQIAEYQKLLDISDLILSKDALKQLGKSQK